MNETMRTSDLVAIESEIMVVAGELHHARARLLRLVGEFDAAGGWVAGGAVSCAHWLAGLLDVEVCTAREHVRVARALRGVPRIRGDFDRGELSYAKVRHLTRVATVDNEDELIDMARRIPAGHLPRTLADWQHRHDPDGLRDRQRDELGLSVRELPSGSKAFTLTLPPAEAAAFETEIDAEVMRGGRHSDASADASDSTQRETLRAMRAHAICRLIRARRTGKNDEPTSTTSPTSRPSCELVVHRRVGDTELANGLALHPETAKRLACDPDVRIMTHRVDWSPADVGRRHRLVTPRLRRLVHERDRCCTYPGCRGTAFLDVHHIVHWEQGGPTALANLTLLCSHHHDWIHEHRWPPDHTPDHVRRAREQFAAHDDAYVTAA